MTRFDTLSASTRDAWAGTCDRLCLPPENARRLVSELMLTLEGTSGKHPPRPRGYTDLPAAFHAQVSAFAHSEPAGQAPGLLDLLLLELIRQFERRFTQAALPESLLPYYLENLDRMLQRTTLSPQWARSSRDDIFLKDLGILRMWLIPCASHLVYRHSGVPRSLVLRQAPGNLMRALVYFGLRSHGFAPFLENHVHPAMLSHFNPEGRQRCYALVAELLQRWPESRGLMGISWYYDPAVRTISPHLAYLRDEPERGGALFLPAGSGPDAIAGATATSDTRRRLHEQGRYTPTRYLMAWSRTALMNAHGV